MGEDSVGDNNTDKKNGISGALNAAGAANAGGTAGAVASPAGAHRAGEADAGNSQDVDNASGSNASTKICYF